MHGRELPQGLPIASPAPLPTPTHTRTSSICVQLLHADVGSVTMWALPKGFGDKSMDEMFMQASGWIG